MDSDADGSEDALESFVADLNFGLSCFRIENWLLILDRKQASKRLRLFRYLCYFD